MNEDVRCPECGARNGTDAQWCTQCYTSLVPEPEPEPEPEPGPEPEPERGSEQAAAPETASAPLPPPPPPSSPPPPPPANAATASPAPAGSEDVAAEEPDGLLPLPPPAGPAGTGEGAPARALRAGDGRFRETAAGLEWRCGVCEEWNPIERLTCTLCATPFGRTLGAEPEPERPDVPPAVLTIASLVLPGLGHWLLGLRGAGVLRAVLALVWGLGGLSLFLQARASGQSFLPAVPLLLGWAVVAAGSANDAVVEGGGTGNLVLSGRFLLWLTLGVVGGTFAAVLVGVLSAVGQ